MLAAEESREAVEQLLQGGRKAHKAFKKLRLVNVLENAAQLTRLASIQRTIVFAENEGGMEMAWKRAIQNRTLHLNKHGATWSSRGKWHKGKRSKFLKCPTLSGMAKQRCDTMTLVLKDTKSAFGKCNTKEKSSGKSKGKGKGKSSGKLSGKGKGKKQGKAKGK